MRHHLGPTLAASLALVGTAFAQLAIPSTLVGTWSTKSNSTLTGSGFFDFANDQLIEPAHTGISYSFSSDGFFESAYYRAIANPANPQCPSGILQWQHGTSAYKTDGTLELTPFSNDGRQLLSTACNGGTGIYSRYNQSETFERFSVYVDPYHGITRLDLFRFDGSPVQPLYLVYSPPTMLPTSTLFAENAEATGATDGTTSTANAKLRKRSPSKEAMHEILNRKLASKFQSQAMDPDKWWWVGLTLTGIGGLLYFGPRRMGISL